jgi:hypothetical protein
MIRSVLVTLALLTAAPVFAGTNCRFDKNIGAQYCDGEPTIYREKRGKLTYYYEQGTGRSWTGHGTGALYENGTTSWRRMDSNGKQRSHLERNSPTDGRISDLFQDEEDEDEGDDE